MALRQREGFSYIPARKKKYLPIAATKVPQVEHLCSVLRAAHSAKVFCKTKV